MPDRQHKSVTYHEGYADGCMDRARLINGDPPGGPQQNGWMYRAGYDHGLAGECES